MYVPGDTDTSWLARGHSSVSNSPLPLSSANATPDSCAFPSISAAPKAYLDVQCTIVNVSAKASVIISHKKRYRYSGGMIRDSLALLVGIALYLLQSSKGVFSRESSNVHTPTSLSTSSGGSTKSLSTVVDPQSRTYRRTQCSHTHMLFTNDLL